MTTSANSSRRRLLFLVCLLLVLAGLKATYNPGIGRNSLDGDFYYQIARNVAEGNGLKTNLSLYHQGLKSFPRESNIAPLWPLTLGHSGKLLGLDTATKLVPELLYLLDLVLLYLLACALAQRLGGDPLLVRSGGTVDFGHLAVLGFGLNPIFFEFTSLPYTEALAFFFFLAALLALDRARNGSLPWAAFSGGLAAAAFMTRAQMIGILVAVPLTLALMSKRQRPLLLSTGVAVLAAVVVLLPWVLFLLTFVEPFNPRVMISLGIYRETPELPPFNQTVAIHGFGDRIRTVLMGLTTAFDPRNGNSYLASFSWAAWLVPIALIQLVVQPARLKKGLQRVFDAQYSLPVATFLAAAAMLAPLHNRRAIYFKEWLFGFRHGLPMMLLILIAFILLWQYNGRILRITALCLFSAGVLFSAVRVQQIHARPVPSGLLGPEAELVEWLAQQPEPPVVITSNAQTLAAFSEAGFHWTSCQASPESTKMLLSLAGADYVLLYPREERCSFLEGLQDDLELFKVFRHELFQVGVLRPRIATP